MIQVDERELSIVTELANRAPKSDGEEYALQLIVNKWNFQVRQNEKARSGAKEQEGELNVEA